MALADSTALPEIGGEAGWYFDPNSEDAIANAIRRLLDDSGERARRAMLGRAIAGHYRWQNANDLLVEALVARHEPDGLRSPRTLPASRSPRHFFDPSPQDRHRPIDGRDVRRLVEPSADAGGMGQGQVADAVADRGGADDVRERPERAEERPDRQRADEQDDLGLGGRRSARRARRGRGPAPRARGRDLPGRRAAGRDSSG